MRRFPAVSRAILPLLCATIIASCGPSPSIEPADPSKYFTATPTVQNSQRPQTTPAPSSALNLERKLEGDMNGKGQYPTPQYNNVTPTIVIPAVSSPTRTAQASVSISSPTRTAQVTPSRDDLISSLIMKYNGVPGGNFGEFVTGVKQRLDTKDKVIALTFDACGASDAHGPGNGYDGDLINYLITERIPATLFINARWIDARPDTFASLAKNPLFLIGNHGLEHKPLSMDGKSAYGIKGTGGIKEVISEIEGGGKKIASITKSYPRYFRSGTAYYDETSVKVAADLGYSVVNYSVLPGDAVAGTQTSVLVKGIMKAGPGSIILMHMNHPEWNTNEAIRQAVPLLRAEGYRFVRLSEYPLK